MHVPKHLNEGKVERADFTSIKDAALYMVVDHYLSYCVGPLYTPTHFYTYPMVFIHVDVIICIGPVCL